MSPRKHRWPQEEITRLADLHDYILDHLNEDLSLATLARRTSMNERKMNEAFFYVYKEKLPKFIQSERMKKASALLTGSDHSIKQIAEACGYKSPYAFHRAFKQSTGQTPASLRNLPSSAENKP